MAHQIRPKTLAGFVGQKHLVGPGSWLKKAIERDQLTSMILFGPPGSGKTTLAYIVAQATRTRFVKISAVLGTVKELKVELAAAEQASRLGQRTIVFIDEIHRFNKAQQDVLLPYIESGAVVLIGATTENPSFEVIAPLTSRAKVLTLNRLEIEDLEQVLDRALLELKGVKIDSQARREILEAAGGDARILLNLLEDLAALEKKITKKTLERAKVSKILKYDKGGEEHYNIISALHKSMRDSDPDAAVYWLMRMLEAGDDPLYIARRLIRFASEDIGIADPHALLVATAAYEASHFIGLPECDVILAQAAIHLCLAPKSNACYKAVLGVRADIKRFGNLDVPLHIRNAPTRLMKEWGYGKGYKYAHNFKGAKVEQEHLPAKLKGRKYYQPTDRGLERRINKN